MVRTELREHIFKMLFQIEFNTLEEMPKHLELYFEELTSAKEKDKEYIQKKLEAVVEKLEEIDAILNEKATGWKTSRMNKVDLAILRLAVYEIKWDDDVPVKVAINEAVELAKKFSGEEGPAVVNGVLAKIADERWRGGQMLKNVYTVKQVNAYIKNMFTQDFMLNRLYVKGEVSNCKYHPSGHIYFSLKDESGTIACVMFAGSRSGLSFRMQEGQQVVVLGSVSVYERDGRYQMYAREIILDGAGELYLKFEALKKELEEMGMFAQEYKRPIPQFVKKVGIVTASSGAAVRDIINIAARRNPYVQLILCPAKVQGEGAAESIVQGIRMLEEQDVDVMIVGRGGGSIEDLWAFNEEIVARVIFESRVPVISAVGHETDTTIADYVADLRAPTPSAAAELAVYEYQAAENLMKEYQMRLSSAVLKKAEQNRQYLKQAALKLRLFHPRQKLLENRQYASDLELQLRSRMEEILQQKRHQFALYVEKMKGLSPLEKLNQGYAYVEDKKGRPVRQIAEVKEGDAIRIYVSDGMIEAQVKGMTEEIQYHA